MNALAIDRACRWAPLAAAGGQSGARGADVLAVVTRAESSFVELRFVAQP